jgi:hypothetical protein
VADLDDLRGASLAALNAIGMGATIVGVPLLVARQLVGGRRGLVLPTAVAIATVLTAATRRTGWSLVKLWLGIDRPRAMTRRRAQDSGR